MKLEYIGMDNWDRPVYKDEKEKLWKDVDPRKHRNHELCTSMYNEFDGEPDTPMSVMKKYEGIEVEFVPKRVTW